MTSFNQDPNRASGHDDQMDAGEYVFDVELNIDFTKLIISCSDNTLSVYDYESMVLQSKIPAHTDTINCIESSKESPFLVYSGSSDGIVALWDLRLGAKAVLTYKIPEEVYALSVGFADTLLTTAYDSSILFFDLRNGASKNRTLKNKLAEYPDVHSDFVTQLKFNPSNQNILTSAAEDGLICILDPTGNFSFIERDI